MALATQIRQAREAKGMSTTQLAFHLHRSAQTVIAYESGTITPPISVVKDLAQVLDVSIDDLVADAEEPS